MKFTLIHPSRERCDMAVEAFNNWINKASGQHEIEYILSIDEDDSQIECYKKTFGCATILINPNRSIVDAVNIAAMHATGDCLIVISDDFDCPQDWDIELLEATKILPPFGDPTQENFPVSHYAILINDGIQTSTMTLPIISRSVYQKLGHIYHPGYFSVYADNEITEVCELMGVLIKAPHLLFKHNHYTVTGQKPDSTYLRENNQHAYTMGKRLFETRQAKGFDLKVSA